MLFILLINLYRNIKESHHILKVFRFALFIYELRVCVGVRFERRACNTVICHNINGMHVSVILCLSFNKTRIIKYYTSR